ncbi:hypothetical protein OGAPHI_001667 [Ogataea philodendri]|uniref:Uncharacterized protein n=1 Tax=Ogataea philodendri TaxID=1378263 RepID=A0A9P8PC38_9ASCO|nr:uncharacterized protein OGAPHI_001667 [Ogataea philodendri]KAH3669071.1 hypothetical protein OGAPHI_001667 [Ogataea philodendri]
MTRRRPNKWTPCNWSMAFSASFSVLNSTNAKPLADLLNFLGTLTDLRFPNGLNSSNTSFRVDSKAKFLTIIFGDFLDFLVWEESDWDWLTLLEILSCSW